jgi:hypothetical protein
MAHVVRQIEIFGIPFFSQEATMSALLELRAPGLDELARVVENDHGILALIVDKDPLLGIYLDAMRIPILYALGEFAPPFHDFVGMLAAS